MTHSAPVLAAMNTFNAKLNHLLFNDHNIIGFDIITFDKTQPLNTIAVVTGDRAINSSGVSHLDNIPEGQERYFTRQVSLHRYGILEALNLAELMDENDELGITLTYTGEEEIPALTSAFIAATAADIHFTTDDIAVVPVNSNTLRITAKTNSMGYHGSVDVVLAGAEEPESP